MSNALFHRLIASSAKPGAPLLRASLLATLCLLYVSGYRKAELIAYLPERKTWLTRASLLWVRSLPASEQVRCDWRGLGGQRAHAYLPEGKTWLTRASLLWVIGGVLTKHPTPQQLHALSAGDRCEISPRQSKCDATEEVWGNRPIALAYADVLHSMSTQHVTYHVTRETLVTRHGLM
eukprot:750907-Pleurochrysis_carterae.AAC.1